MAVPAKDPVPKAVNTTNLHWRPSLRFCAVLVFSCCLALAQQDAQQAKEEYNRLLTHHIELLKAAQQHYGGEVSSRDLVYASIQGMLRGLDPHTSFLSPRAFSGLREREAATYSGIGILLSIRDGHPTVVSPIEGGPAGELGVLAGDVIESVDDRRTEDLSLDEVVARIKGPKGTQVDIIIRRRGLDQPIELTVTRAELPQETVRYAYMMTPEVGYLLLTDFSQSTAQEVSAALERLKEQGMKRLLLDLRNNGGGLFHPAIQVAGHFVPRGEVVVETRGRVSGSRRVLRSQGTQGPDEEWGLPLVVLVNRGTASAAEILSGAIQDHDLGLLVGTPTWGKGLVQTVYKVAGDAGLALTTARYHTPSGRQIQRDFTSFYDYYAVVEQSSVRGDPGGRHSEKSFSTKTGRTVYGGGGIRPDLVVESTEITAFQQLLLIRNAFMKFAVDHRRRRDPPARSWRADAETLAEFRRWLIAEGFDDATVDEALASKAECASVLSRISAAVLNFHYGSEAQHRALAESDPQISAALSLFDESAALLALPRSQ